MSNIRHPAGCRKQGTEMSEITEGIADILTMKQELVDAKETIEQLRRELDTANKVIEAAIEIGEDSTLSFSEGLMDMIRKLRGK